MTQPNASLTVSDLGLGTGDEEEALDVLDLPQLYTKPPARTLLATLEDLSSAPPSWESTPRSHTPRSISGTSTPLRRKRQVKNAGVPRYLTNIISSPLAWIADDAEKEQIWQAASVRLSERSGRTAMGAISRCFTIPLDPATVELSSGPIITTEQALAVDEENILEIALHEPALTADNLGLKTWASSYLLAKRLVLLRAVLPALPDGSLILELGAGTGLVGIAAAAILEARVILTDLPDIVPNLDRNARANAATVSDHGGSIDTAILDWTNPAAFTLPDENTQCPAHLVPLILAADPIYSSDHPRLLVQAIDRHLSRDNSARVVIEMPLRSAFGAERRNFRDCMIELGLTILDEGEEIGYDDWSEGPSESELMEVRCWWSVWAWR